MTPWNNRAGRAPRAGQGSDTHSHSGNRGHWESDEEGFSRFVPPQRRPRAPPLIGTGKSNRLQVVKSIKRCNIFVGHATLWRIYGPHTTVEDISRVVQEIIKEKPLHIKKLKTRYPSYASFQVTALEEHHTALLSSDAWDEGALVRNFFVRRQFPPFSDSDSRRHVDIGNKDKHDGIAHSTDVQFLGSNSNTVNALDSERETPMQSNMIKVNQEVRDG